MQQKRYRWLLRLLLLTLIAGIPAGNSFGQDEDNEYVGTRECRSCHRSYTNDHEETIHFRTLLEVAEIEDDLEEFIPAIFAEDNESLRTILFNEEERPFTLDDILYSLGAGRHYQAYITDIDGVLRVLPVQWDIAAETWVALELAEDWSDPAYDFATQCAGCHVTNFDTEDLTWDEAGVQCEACHGPGLLHVEIADDAGSSISDDEYEALSSAINFGLSSETCGQCHVRGTDEASGFPHPVGFQPDMALQDVFTPVATDDSAAWYDTVHARLPNMQYNEWLQSSHTTALASAQESENFDASCLGCHSVAQQRVNYLIDEDWVDEDEFDPLSTLDGHGFGITCASCHNPHEVDNDVFLIEEDTYALCINCHNNGEDTADIHHPVQEVFEGLALVETIEPIAGVHFSAEDGPTCMTCHMQEIATKNGIRQSHTFHPVSPGGAADIEDLQDSCTICHTDVEDPVQMQALIDSVQDSVAERITLVQDNLADDTPEWVAQAVAAIEGDGSRGIHNFAYTSAMLAAVEAELGIVSATVSDSDVSELVAETLPEPINTIDLSPREPVVPPVGGMTGPSQGILGICILIIVVAFYSFFVRGGQND